MINKEKKESIVKYYLEVKNIKKVIDKFKIARQTVYNIIEEFEIPKPSEMRNEELDEEFDPELFLDAEGNK